MKGIFGLILCLGVLIFVGNWFLTHEMTRDRGHKLAIAFGDEDGDTIQMHLGVPESIPQADPPEFSILSGPLWEDWIKKHFELLDVNGERVEHALHGANVRRALDRL